MSTLTVDRLAAPPAWVVDQMPPGYRTRLSEIERLAGELREMDRFARLLWEVGGPLEDAVRDAFAAMKLEIDPVPPPGTRRVAVRLKHGRRLLVEVADADGRIQKKSPAVARVFQLVQEVAGHNDRVVLVATSDAERRPTDRPDPVDADALALLERLGVNVMSGPAMFAFWSLWLQDADRARKYLDRLHEQDGGVFQAPTV
ncbi:MAG: hypothetical protein IT184_17080 [Acidobacteria bacterium]|nr:hypothetical protein [Acidobacteriota bacterium]